MIGSPDSLDNKKKEGKERWPFRKAVACKMEPTKSMVCEQEGGCCWPDGRVSGDKCTVAAVKTVVG